jgi:hypothetical protein
MTARVYRGKVDAPVFFVILILIPPRQIRIKRMIKIKREDQNGQLMPAET